MVDVECTCLVLGGWGFVVYEVGCFFFSFFGSGGDGWGVATTWKVVVTAQIRDALTLELRSTSANCVAYVPVQLASRTSCSEYGEGETCVRETLVCLVCYCHP